MDDILNFYAQPSQLELLASIHFGQNWRIDWQMRQAIARECWARMEAQEDVENALDPLNSMSKIVENFEGIDNAEKAKNGSTKFSKASTNWPLNKESREREKCEEIDEIGIVEFVEKNDEKMDGEEEGEEEEPIEDLLDDDLDTLDDLNLKFDQMIGENSGLWNEESSRTQLLALIREKVASGSNAVGKCLANVLESNEFSEAKLATWRASFERILAERSQNKFRLRNVLSHRMYRFNLQRLRVTEHIDPRQLSLSDLRIRERYTLRGDRLVERTTGRLFVSVEEMFDALFQFHVGTGHGGQKKAIYRQASRVFANVSKELVRAFLQGCGRCGGWREKKCWPVLRNRPY